MVQMVFSLAAVVAIILGLAWMTRRMQGLRATSNAELRVKSTLAVGIKERVVLIEACGQQILIGVAPGQVTMLKDLGTAASVPDTAVAIPASASPSGSAGNPGLGEAFAIQLNKLLGR